APRAGPGALPGAAGGRGGAPPPARRRGRQGQGGVGADAGGDVRAHGLHVLARYAASVLISTMNDVPGHEVDEVLGEVFGLTVRSRNLGSQIGAGLKSVFGGELKGMTKMLADSRGQALERLVAEAEAKGANAILAMRFDTSELGSTWTEICAYGTAVRLRTL